MPRLLSTAASRLWITPYAFPAINRGALAREGKRSVGRLGVCQDAETQAHNQEEMMIACTSWAMVTVLLQCPAYILVKGN